MAQDWQAYENQSTMVNVAARTPENIRVAIVDEEDVILTEEFFEDADDSNDKYLSRDMIKKTMRQYTESVTVKKRRQKKK